MVSRQVVHPVIEVGDIDAAVAWSTGALGVELAFDDGGRPPNDVGLRPDLTPADRERVEG